MPLYDFRCGKCGQIDEFLVKREPAFSFSFSQHIACSRCGSENVQRLIGSPSVHFKGGGWAKDLYGSSKVKGAETQES